ncbi:MAG: hypothetical protein AB1796_11380 [Bacillota bacterium]
MSGTILRRSRNTFLLSAILIIYSFSAVLLPSPAQGTTNIQPLLVIERVTAERAVAGDVFYVTVTVNNLGDFPAFNIFAEISSPRFQGEDVFTMGTAASEENPHLAKLEAGETRGFSFPVKVSSKAENVDYNLGITLKSQDAYFNPAIHRTSANTTVKVNYEVKQPRLSIRKVTLDPQTPGETEPFTAVFYLENHSGAEAQNVTVEINGIVGGKENFQVLETTHSKFLPSIARGSDKFVVYRLRGVPSRSANSVILNFKYEYRGEALTASHVVNLPLEQAAPGTAPHLTIDSFFLRETARDHEYRIRLTLKNLGEQEAADVRLTFDGGAKIYVLQGSNVDYLPAIAGKSSLEMEYLLGINRAAGDTHLPLNVKLEYKDSTGNALTPVSETLGISAADLREKEESAQQGTPRVLISKYTLSEEKILAGNVVTLKLFIENTHTRPVQNIKVSLSVSQVEGGGTGSAASAGGGTVFSPINSSNSFFIDRIPARTMLEHSVDLLVDPNATARTYIVPVIIEYEDENAKGYEVREMVNIPVTQESRLQVLSVEIPPMAFMGQPIFVGAEFVNVGKVDLGNFIVMLEGDFHKEQAAYFVGNLQIGQSDYYQGIIYPDREGTLQGKLIFSYVDNNNREVQVVEPFRIEVQAGGEMGQPIDGEMPPHLRDPNNQAWGGSKKLYYYIVPVVLILSAAVIILLRRRARKAREEFLDA